METLLLIPAIAFYVLLMPFFFLKWVTMWQQDHISEAQPIDLVFIAIATLFWPLIIPFAYLDLLEHSAH